MAQKGQTLLVVYFKVKVCAGASEKVASDLGLGSGFCPGTQVFSTTTNWLVKATIWDDK